MYTNNITCSGMLYMSSGMPDGQQASLFSMCESSNADGNPAVHAQSVAGSSSTVSACGTKFGILFILWI